MRAICVRILMCRRTIAIKEDGINEIRKRRKSNWQKLIHELVKFRSQIERISFQGTHHLVSVNIDLELVYPIKFSSKDDFSAQTGRSLSSSCPLARANIGGEK